MIYEIRDRLIEIKPEAVDSNQLTVGCVSCDEIRTYGKIWGFDPETIEASQRANPLFRTGVDVHEKYTFTELRILNRRGKEDFVAMYVKKNFMLIVDIIDEDESTIGSFLNALKKYPCQRLNMEKIIFYFIESLLSEGNAISEELRNRLTEMEEAIVKGSAKENFNVELLEIKKQILNYYNFYGQILDIVETLEENENEILNEDKLMYISNLSGKVTRLSEDMKMLTDISVHLQEAYATMLDQRMNNTMKIFTIITTIFFPLTIIVGWYGMNFYNMPELTWKYGYLYVCLLSIVVSVVLILIGKKKKWF